MDGRPLAPAHAAPAPQYRTGLKVISRACTTLMGDASFSGYVRGYDAQGQPNRVLGENNLNPGNATVAIFACQRRAHP